VVVEPEIPTEVQLGVSKATLIRRALLLRCPACGEGGVIKRWFGIVDRCPTCDLQIERIEGHMIGYIGLNVVVCFALLFVVLLVGALVMMPNIRPWPLIAAAAVPGVLGPILFAPGSRTTWTAIDMLMRPLRPGEIDPRYVEVDPARDRLAGDDPDASP
jgi:uncharacterized protein (DUF983 family)